MDSSANYYELLGLSRKATQPEIKAAYKDLARLFHPDSNFYDEILGDGSGNVNIESDDLFQRMTAAYEVLSNVDRRLEYDSSLPQGLRDWNEQPADRAEHLERVKAAILKKSFGKAPVQFDPGTETVPGRSDRRTVAMSQMLKRSSGPWNRIKALLGLS
jgi:curved DNA-binding protein CbpA